MAFKIGELFVRLFTDRTEYKKGLADAKKDAETFVSATNSLVSKAAGIAIGYFSAKGIIDMGRAALESADRLNGLSQITGVTVEDLSRLGYAATLSGSSTEGLSTSLKFLGKNIDEASRGSDEAVQAFRAVGVSLSDLKSKSPREILLDISDAFSKGEVSGSKAAAAMKLLGREGAEMVPFLNLGAVEIKRLSDEADRLGITVSSQFAHDAEVFNDRIQVMKMRLDAVASTIVSAVMPSLMTLTGYLGGQYKSSADEASASTARWAGFVGFLAKTFIMASHGMLVWAAGVVAAYKVATSPFTDNTIEGAFKEWVNRIDGLNTETTAALTDLLAPTKDVAKATKEAAGATGELSDKAKKAALQLQQQNLQLQLQKAQLDGNIEKYRELSDALDKVAAAQLRMEKAPESGIADFLRLSKEIREEQLSRESSDAVVSAEADVGRQLIALTVSREAAIGELEKQAHEERVAQYKRLLVAAEDRDALIQQSHALMVENIAQADANYGRNWETLLQRMIRKYDDLGSQVGVTTEAIVGRADTLFSDVLFAGIEGNLEKMKDAFRSFAQAVIREITNIMAAKAVAMFLKFFASSGTTDASGFVGLGSSSQLGTKATGGVFPGGFSPITQFSMGGIVNKPTLGLVGEGQFNEAVVPLLNGSSIPVDMRGGGRQTIENHMTVALTADFLMGIRPMMQPTQGEIVMAVGRDILVNGELRRVIRSTIGR